MTFDSVFSSLVCSDCTASQDSVNSLLILGEKSVCDICVENYPECVHCGSYTRYNYDFTRVEGRLVCPDCLDNLVKCDCCDRYFERDQITITGDSSEVCEECLDENYSVCDYYQEYYPTSEIVQTGDVWRRLMPSYSSSTSGSEVFYVSQSAIDLHFTHCQECGEYYHDDMMHSTQGRNVCDNCCSEHYFTCDQCGETYHRDREVYDEANDRCICNYCEESLTPSVTADPSKYPSEYCKHVKDYHDLRADKLGFFGKANDKRFYGLEVETRSGCPENLIYNADQIMDDPDLSKFMILTEDGSLNRDGNRANFEIVTAPATYQEHKRLWQIFFAKKFKGLTSWKSGFCGIHIHVSRAALTPLQIGKCVVFVNEASNKDFITAIAGRYSGQYCNIDHGKKVTHCKRTRDRYEAINLRNDATIEFRIFRGTLLPLHFYANLEFVKALLDYTNQCSINQLHYSQFLKWVKSQPKKSYPSLVEFLATKGY